LAIAAIHVHLQVNVVTEWRATKIIRMLGNLSSHLEVVEQSSDADSCKLEEHIAIEEVQKPPDRELAFKLRRIPNPKNHISSDDDYVAFTQGTQFH